MNSSSMMEIDDKMSTAFSSSSGDSVVDSSINNNNRARPITAPVAVGNSNSTVGNNPPLRAIHTAPYNQSSSNNNNEQNVRVVARVRPLSNKEITEKSSESIVAYSNQSTIRVHSSSSSSGGDFTSNDNNEKRNFEFDSVFGPNSTQKQVYEETCGDMINSSIFKGFNATILAYGQTGSGKTFTMGTDGSSTGVLDSSTVKPPSQSEGIIARAVYDLFQAKNSLPNGSNRVKVTMSYLEIYNEQAIDLLNDDPASANATLQVRDSKTDGVVIPNLKHFDVSSPSEVSALMEKASLKRATGSTQMNSVSSRSHAICTLIVTIAPDDESREEAEDDGNISPRSSTTSSSSSSDHAGMKAKLTLVDLAGSERIKRTGAEGARMKEGININKGLFVLGQVVSALSELGQQRNGGGSHHHSHIPYRDSKLTRLLQDSLGGNSRTVMIACISPAESNIEESTNTLRYAERTRNIKNSAVRNVMSSGISASEAAALRRENQQLKLELARMEASMIVSKSSGGFGNCRDGRKSSIGFSFGGLFSTDNNMENVSQLQAQCSSLLAEIDLLKESAKDHSAEMLEASLRADKWQSQAEAIVKLAQSQGVNLSGAQDVSSSSDGDLVSQLRRQLTECKTELFEARTEAVVARATAGAIIAGNGDLSNIEEMASSSGDTVLNMMRDDEGDNSQKLTTELSSVSATIEQKEAMVVQMNKERACRDNLQLHFESSLKLLMTEVDLLTAERDELMVKMADNEQENKKSNPSQQQRRNKRKTADNPINKKLRDQINKLEGKIDDLKGKANEHKRSMRMKEEAEKKCSRLMAEIAEDKRRRADLQKKLKETSVEMRAEKMAAKQKAAKMMKDSQRLKIELQKMKSASQKQAAVLKRKIDQASAKEKARIEFEKKRRSADKMRLASSSMDNAGVKESRKVELSSWVDQELEITAIRSQLNDQRRQLDKAESTRKKLVKNSDDAVNVEELEHMDGTIRSLRTTVHELEMTAKKAFPAILDSTTISTFRFLDTDTFKGLGKADAKYVLSYIFDTCTSLKQEMATTISRHEASTKTSVDSALAKEQQLHEKEITKIKMEHGDAILKLLESTQDTVNSNIKLKVDSGSDELREQVDSILETYNESWTATADSLSADLEEIKDTQMDLETMMDDIAKGMTVIPKKSKAKKKKAPVQHDYDSEAFESEESFFQDDGGEDSEYEPTPAKKSKHKRRSPRLANKKKVAVPASPASPIGENFIDELDNKKVGSLKKACKKLGVPVTGKKADLKQRVREHILNSSVAMPNTANEEALSDESFIAGSAMKKVNFAGDDMAVDTEFQPVAADNPTPTECIKKKLWCDAPGNNDDVPSEAAKKEKPKSVAAVPSTRPPKTPSKVVRSPKRKRDDRDDDIGSGGDGEKEDCNNSQTPSKRTRLGFGSSSPRNTGFGFSPRPLSSHNVVEQPTSRTPVHLKQTIATSKKRLVPDAKQSNAVTKRSTISYSQKKRTKKGMNLAVAQALQCLGNGNDL